MPPCTWCSAHAGEEEVPSGLSRQTCLAPAQGHGRSDREWSRLGGAGAMGELWGGAGRQALLRLGAYGSLEVSHVLQGWSS